MIRTSKLNLNTASGFVPLGLSGGSSGGGASEFIDLTDVPATYVGSGSKVVSVKSDASGLEFTTPAASSFDTNFSVTLSGTHAVTAGANRKILFDTVEFDGNSEWVVASTHWLCKVSGYYGITISGAPVNTYTNYFRTVLYIDGVSAGVGQNITGTSGTTTASLLHVPNKYIASGSYVEAYCSVDVNTTIQAGAGVTFFRIIRYK